MAPPLVFVEGVPQAGFVFENDERPRNVITRTKFGQLCTPVYLAAGHVGLYILTATVADRARDLLALAEKTVHARVQESTLN